MKNSPRSKSALKISAALLLGTTISAVYAQGVPKLSDVGWPTQPGGPKPPKPCVELSLPTPSGTGTARLAAPGTATKGVAAKPDNSGGGSATPPDVLPAAVSVWSLTSTGVYSYCVQAGIISNQATLNVPMTLTLKDMRYIDKDYQNSYAAISQPVPTSHPTVAQQQHTIAAPVGSGQSVVPATWCLSDIDWKKRPRLLLTLTAPASAQGQPALNTSCWIAPGQKLANPAGFKPALDSKVKTGKWPTVTPPRGTGTSVPLEPAKKIDPPKEPAGKKILGGGAKIGEATAINAKPTEAKTK